MPETHVAHTLKVNMFASSKISYMVLMLLTISLHLFVYFVVVVYVYVT